MVAERVRVVCTNCSWAGRRLAAGDPCPECEKPTIEASKRSKSPESGRRVRVVAHVAPATAEALERERVSVGAVGIGTVAGAVLDTWADWAKPKPKPKGG